MERATICNTCFEEDNVEIPCKGFIDGEPYCQKHLAALNGMAKHYGLAVTPTEDELIEDGIKAAKNLTRIIPPIDDSNSLVSMIGEVIHGVLDGSYSAKQANAVCQLSNTALKALELDWKMKRSKDISYIVKQLDEKPA